MALQVMGPKYVRRLWAQVRSGRKGGRQVTRSGQSKQDDARSGRSPSLSLSLHSAASTPFATAPPRDQYLRAKAFWGSLFHSQWRSLLHHMTDSQPPFISHSQTLFLKCGVLIDAPNSTFCVPHSVTNLGTMIKVPLPLS